MLAIKGVWDTYELNEYPKYPDPNLPDFTVYILGGCLGTIVHDIGFTGPLESCIEVEVLELDELHMFDASQTNRVDIWLVLVFDHALQKKSFAPHRRVLHLTLFLAVLADHEFAGFEELAVDLDFIHFHLHKFHSTHVKGVMQYNSSLSISSIIHELFQ